MFVDAGDYEQGAERLFEKLVASCEPEATFAAQVEAALVAALTLFAAEPELARRLAAEPYRPHEVEARRRQDWMERYGALLRRVVDAAPEATSPPISVEPALIAGVFWQISRCVRDGRAKQLEDLLPGLLEFLLAYYLDPQEAGRFASAARSRISHRH